MEKYGVGCKCAEGHPDMGGMEKLASGDRKCGSCGRVYGNLKLKDEVKIRDKGPFPVKGK